MYDEYDITTVRLMESCHMTEQSADLGAREVPYHTYDRCMNKFWRFIPLGEAGVRLRLSTRVG